MAKKGKVPPIFTMSDCLEATEVGETAQGDPYIRLVNSEIRTDGVRDIAVIYTVWRRRKRIVYSYSIVHGDLVEEYHGPHGDPDKDHGGPFLML